MDIEALRDAVLSDLVGRISSVGVGPGYSMDNLAVALCGYFEGHHDRPEGDEPESDEACWGPWVIEQQEFATKAVATAALECVLESVRRATATPVGLPLQQEPKYTTNGHALVNRASGEAIPADEPVFVFRARDVHAREAIEAYACVLLPGLHRDKVCERIADFARFAYANPRRMKVPDTAQVLLVASGEELRHD